MVQLFILRNGNFVDLGICKLTINFVNRLIIVEPQAGTPINIVATNAVFIRDEDLLNIQNPYGNINICLQFDNENSCQRIYNAITRGHQSQVRVPNLAAT